MTDSKTLETFEKDVEYMIKKESDGILIYDIQCRYRTIESDIIAYAQAYGFDPEWTEEEQKIIDESERPDDEIEWIYETSQRAEDYLNDMLQKANITGWSFARISESEIWGLFPDSTFEEDY